MGEAADQVEPAKVEQPAPLTGSWDDPNGISDERNAELDKRQHTWEQETDHGERQGPFDSVELSGADVFWLAARALAGSERDTTAAEARLRAARDNVFLRSTLDPSALHLEGAYLRAAHLEGARLTAAHLEGARLTAAHLEGTRLTAAHLERTDLTAAHLEGARMPADEVRRLRQWDNEFADILPPADLREAFLSPATNLAGITLGEAEFGFASVADVRWGGVNLAVVKWARQSPQKRRRRLNAVILGDEWQAQRAKDDNGKAKNAQQRLAEFEAAVRANRQLATVLRDQGLNEDADRFGYRAQVLQRKVLWRQGQGLRWFGALFLDVIAGHGYRPGRSILTYIGVNGVFAAIYAVLAYFGLTAEKFASWDSPLVLSVTSFHGRVFFAGQLPLTDWAARVGAMEAVVGLLIEITFIATFTNRFFAR